MDLREKKTIRSIENAFLKLRAKKPLERITVKELVKLAEVSKSTFYAHYKDVYDLSEKMQKDVIRKIFDDIPRFDTFFTDLTQFMCKVFAAWGKYSEITDIIFTGRQYYVLSFYVEQGMKEYIFRDFPDLKDDVKLNTWLSFFVQGSFSAYVENHERFGDEEVIKELSEIVVNIPAPFPLI